MTCVISDSTHQYSFLNLSDSKYFFCLYNVVSERLSGYVDMKLRCVPYYVIVSTTHPFSYG